MLYDILITLLVILGLAGWALFLAEELMVENLKAEIETLKAKEDSHD